jgi:hypothetical protein
MHIVASGCMHSSAGYLRAANCRSVMRQPAEPSLESRSGVPTSSSFRIPNSEFRISSEFEIGRGANPLQQRCILLHTA